MHNTVIQCNLYSASFPETFPPGSLLCTRRAKDVRDPEKESTASGDVSVASLVLSNEVRGAQQEGNTKQATTQAG